MDSRTEVDLTTNNTTHLDFTCRNTLTDLDFTCRNTLTDLHICNSEYLNTILLPDTLKKITLLRTNNFKPNDIFSLIRNYNFTHIHFELRVLFTHTQIYTIVKYCVQYNITLNFYVDILRSDINITKNSIDILNLQLRYKYPEPNDYDKLTKYIITCTHQLYYPPTWIDGWIPYHNDICTIHLFYL
jgi:hypothetical protein